MENGLIAFGLLVTVIMEFPVIELIEMREISPVTVQVASETEANEPNAMLIINKVSIFFMGLSSVLSFSPANIMPYQFQTYGAP